MPKQISYTLPLNYICAIIPEEFRTRTVHDLHGFYGKAAREVASTMDNNGNFSRGRISGKVVEIQYSKEKISVGDVSRLRTSYSGEIYGLHTEKRSVPAFIRANRPSKLVVTLNVTDGEPLQ